LLGVVVSVEPATDRTSAVLNGAHRMRHLRELAANSSGPDTRQFFAEPDPVQGDIRECPDFRLARRISSILAGATLLSGRPS
jgi:hypothetical protein